MQEEERNIEWKWLPCTFNLKRIIKEVEHYENLEPVTVLTIKERKVEMKIDVELEKPFIFNKKSGWSWHKSWNLPTIEVKSEFRDPETGITVNPTNKVLAELLVVKPVFKNGSKFHLIDLGVQGPSTSFLKSCRCEFSSLKFLTTSYNHEEAKFHLLVNIFFEDEHCDSPLLLKSLISPPIFVDSRKSARNSSVIKERHKRILTEKFDPSWLQKKFVKRESKENHNLEEIIKNDLIGLYNYLTAPNIREKVKHPLFLIMYFDTTLKLYVPQEAESPLSMEKILEEIFIRLYNSQSDKNKEKCLKKPYFLKLQTSVSDGRNFIRKIIETLEAILMKTSKLLLLNESNIVPEGYVCVSGSALAECYKQKHESIPEYKEYRQQQGSEKKGMHLEGENEDEDFSDKNTHIEEKNSEDNSSEAGELLDKIELTSHLKLNNDEHSIKDDNMYKTEISISPQDLSRDNNEDFFNFMKETARKNRDADNNASSSITSNERKNQLIHKSSKKSNKKKKLIAKLKEKDVERESISKGSNPKSAVSEVEEEISSKNESPEKVYYQRDSKNEEDYYMMSQSMMNSELQRIPGQYIRPVPYPGEHYVPIWQTQPPSHYSYYSPSPYHHHHHHHHVSPPPIIYASSNVVPMYHPHPGYIAHPHPGVVRYDLDYPVEYLDDYYNNFNNM